MTETPRVLSRTPEPGSADLLSDLLGSMHLTGVVLFRAEFREPWAVVTPDACQLAHVLPFETEHIIPFHIIAEGGCWLDLKGLERVWLEAGDAILLPYGASHRLTGRTDAARPEPVGHLLPRPPWSDILHVQHGGNGELTHIICGFLKSDDLLFHPLLHHLPALMHVRPTRAPTDAWLAATIRHTAEEASRVDPSGRSMLPRLTELMFVEILRNYTRNISAEEAGWFAAATDPVVGPALRFLHTAPKDDWDVERLARRVGVSRTLLGARFKRLLKLPPMQYLTRWRLQLAARTLKTTTAAMKSIAEDAGYDSEAAFSRAFKRHFDLPPGEWRRREALGQLVTRS